MDQKIQLYGVEDNDGIKDNEMNNELASWQADAYYRISKEGWAEKTNEVAEGKSEWKMGEMREEMMVGEVKFLGQNVIDVLCLLRAGWQKELMKNSPYAG